MTPPKDAVVGPAVLVPGAIVTVEEHQIHGGLGGAVAETLAQHAPTPVEMVAMPDHFGESGATGETAREVGPDRTGHRRESSPRTGAQEHLIPDHQRPRETTYPKEQT